MGVWICGKDEIKDKLSDALNNLEGEVMKPDARKAMEELIREYKHFS